MAPSVRFLTVNIWLWIRHCTLLACLEHVFPFTFLSCPAESCLRFSPPSTISPAVLLPALMYFLSRHPFSSHNQSESIMGEGEATEPERDGERKQTGRQNWGLLIWYTDSRVFILPLVPFHTQFHASAHLSQTRRHGLFPAAAHLKVYKVFKPRSCDRGSNRYPQCRKRRTTSISVTEECFHPVNLF